MPLVPSARDPVSGDAIFHFGIGVVDPPVRLCIRGISQCNLDALRISPIRIYADAILCNFRQYHKGVEDVLKSWLGDFDPLVEYLYLELYLCSDGILVTQDNVIGSLWFEKATYVVADLQFVYALRLIEAAQTDAQLPQLIELVQQTESGA